MTTIAMVAGMAPSAYGIGDGGEFRAPMAIGVIGGLIVSTVLSLVFVPSFFSIMDSVANRAGRFFGRFVGPKEEDEATPHGHAALSPHAVTTSAKPPQAANAPAVTLAAE
jgi:hydrophobic/amphiphilic exporter-1 (mainly G- bacteria), HAE1 family